MAQKKTPDSFPDSRVKHMVSDLFFKETHQLGVFDVAVQKTYNQLLDAIIDLKPNESVPEKYLKPFIAQAKKCVALAQCIVEQLKAR